ncbi:MAG TPA: hypothetical protein VF458_10140 [Ktedonobacteraceae bacterium]
MDRENGESRFGVIGNERLTAVAGAMLLVLFVVELVTVPNLRAGLAIHVFIGVLLAGPLAVKLGSTGYRFLRYYTGSPAYVRKGPPRLALRVLAPLLLVTTLVLIGSGIGLMVTGPLHPGPLLLVHGLSTLLWLPLIAIHVFAYLWRALRSLAGNWSKPSGRSEHLARGLRLGVNLGAPLGGAITAILVLPVAAPWSAWVTGTDHAPGPFLILAGLLVTAFALLAAQLFRWR